MIGENTAVQICYLFLLADGECSESEEKLFAEACEKNYGMGASSRKLAIQDYEYMPIVEGMDNSTSIMRAIGKILMRDATVVEYMWEKSDKVRLLWTLINLGYADKEYTEPERKVVEYVAKKFEIAPEDNYALHDIAETMVALVKQKEWVKRSKCSHEEYSKEMSEIDKAMERLKKSVETIVEQADIGA